MFALRRLSLCLLALLACAAGSVGAQEFRVYTRLYDGSTAAGRAATLSRSVALFHARKVYDSGDTPHEMTIFEPAHERFVLLDSSRKLLTVVSFRALRDATHQAERKVNEHIQHLEKSGAARDADEVSHLKFQLHPVFETNLDFERKLVTMKSPLLTYSVKCEPPPDPETANVYLQYTDWAARLNVLAAATGRLPEARLQLDQVLRDRRWLPVEVSLHNRKPERVLTAEHRFEWALTEKDRQQINDWENLIDNGGLRQVSFADYQKNRGKEQSQVRGKESSQARGRETARAGR